MTNEITGKTINTMRALRAAGWKVHRIANFFGLDPWKVAKITARVNALRGKRDMTFTDYTVDRSILPLDQMFR